LLDALRTGVAVVLAISAGCSSPAPANVAHTKTARAPLEVKVVVPERRAMTRIITLTASVEAYEQVPLYAKVAGYIKTINVDIGGR
jgi:multidrug efflux pump subunit AcrA (membrane-fusion protein)